MQIRFSFFFFLFPFIRRWFWACVMNVFSFWCSVVQFRSMHRFAFIRIQWYRIVLWFEALIITWFDCVPFSFRIGITVTTANYGQHSFFDLNSSVFLMAKKNLKAFVLFYLIFGSFLPVSVKRRFRIINDHLFHSFRWLYYYQCHSATQMKGYCKT